MIKKKGVISVYEDDTGIEGLIKDVENLPEGEYSYLIFDGNKNRPLPQLKYLFGVVLKTISNSLPTHPSVDALYRYFEEMYSPIHISVIDNKRYEYRSLKNEKAIEVNDVIDKIINHATEKWGIKIPTQDEICASESKEVYAGAYLEMWNKVLQK